jgi:hypothetical protein
VRQPDLEASPYLRGFAYRYIRASDHIPTFSQLADDDTDIAHVKLFALETSWSWYIASYDPDDRTCFGYVRGHESELGSFSMEELTQYRGRFGLPLERDIHYKPKTLAALYEEDHGVSLYPSRQTR